MYSGTDCPYKGGAERTAEIVNRVYPLMTKKGIDTRRLRLVAICTVCTSAFLREVVGMNTLLQEIGPIQGDLVSVVS
jgi:coenzyme F420-reducing hydrogenase delta subunit